MWIREVTPLHLGPFDGSTTLRLEKNLTVITGANDVGKSVLLHAIEAFCTKQASTEGWYNRLRLNTAKVPWSEDADFGATFEIVNEEPKDRWASSQLDESVSRFKIRACFAPDALSKTRVTHIGRAGELKPHECEVRRRPAVLNMNQLASIRDVLDLDNLNETESMFLKVAFDNITTAKLKAMDEFNYLAFLEQGKNRISERLNQHLPRHLSYTVDFRGVGDSRSKLAVLVFDNHRELSSVGRRGAGAQRLLAYIAALCNATPANGHVILLFDEPENSLHADAQRHLRRFLEEVADHPRIQVVVATHSPVMINSFKPQCIRVVERSQNGGRAGAKISESSANDGWALVRSTLGILPSDSLMYSDVSIVVEGTTECVAIPMIFKKYADQQIEGFEGFEELAPSFHLVNGGGESIFKLAKLAIAQGTDAIVFHDGDKRHKRPEGDDKPPYEVVSLPVGVEMEDVIPRAKYIGAVAKACGLSEETCTLKGFEEWLESSGQPTWLKKKMFSKQVEDWLEASFGGTSLPKARAMQIALEHLPVAELEHRAVFQSLFRKLREAIAKNA